MMKATINYLAILIVSALLFASCGSIKQMAEKADQVKYNVTPNPLEMHAEKVSVDISVTFPPKYFAKKAYLVFTPTLVSEDGQEAKMKEQTLQGEKVKDGNPIISWKTGGSYTYTDTIDYSDPYRMSDLNLSITASQKSKTVPFVVIPLAKGVITTPRLVTNGLAVDNGTIGDTGNGQMATMKQTVSKPESSSGSEAITVYYDLQKANLKSSEKKKEAVKNFLTEIKTISDNQDMTAKGIEIRSYASPDGPEDLNSNLVENRGKTSYDFITKEAKKAEIKGAEDANFFAKTPTSEEDWEGFKKEVENSETLSQEDKDLILRVLNMYSDPVVREREIKNIAQVYNELRNEVLPNLRRSEVKFLFEGKPKTEAELAQIAISEPERLSEQEMFYAAQVCEDNDNKIAIYTKYNELYPNKWEAYNNLGIAYLEKGDLNNAETALNQAKNLNETNAVLNNSGVLYWAKEDYENAEDYFNKALDKGGDPKINYNLGVICIKEARYTEAVEKFGSEASFNKALAQTLAGDNNSALTTIDNIESECADYYYLKAVLAAKADNLNDCVNNLKTAISKKEELIDYAKKDREFLKFAEESIFSALIK